MNIIISGGGTGGHIYPALAIAKEIKKRYKEKVNIYYVGTPNGMEKELAKREGYEYRQVRVMGMPRNLSRESIKSAKELLIGLNDSRKIINELNPKLIIATGGYVCFPISYVGNLKKIPVCIHEQNAFPGITNKILSRYASKVFITFDESKKYFKHPERTILTGNPIREELFLVDKKAAYKAFDLNSDKPIILSFGGSGGQNSLNEAILTYIQSISECNDVQLIHITGKSHYEGFKEALEKKGVDLKENIKIFPYLHDLPKVLNIATLVIASAGAITLAEISALGIPSILIPKAYTAENHQEYNAQVFEDAGASVVIKEKDLNGEVLAKTINELISDKRRLMEMSNNTKKLMNTNATEIIVDELNQYLR
ncbi:MAG TPA: undecaprenyldiphospho-muramoylpentapeptide beta-N-acetylglucosaminyltransferase [Soehngenia sp.]|nr:undecaprenyldiphospho-muramoylpentapeptide beta-N-acetylglucosaminyltransferase [Soehngenia sp.]HPP31962.1 undecaprenyldiphospho-muramoylpentapeptide beta-N-acetylglucosaminyltransferase [Soehngenia sp.]